MCVVPLLTGFSAAAAAADCQLLVLESFIRRGIRIADILALLE